MQTEKEKEEKILALQQPSTRRALLRPPEEDMLWFNRKITNWMAVPDAINMEERVGARAFSYKETKIEENLRRARGAYLAEIRKEIEQRSHPIEKREAAINAFMNVFRPEVITDKFKAFMKMCGLSEKVKDAK